MTSPSSAPPLWVATPHLGAPSEAWLMRQIRLMHAFRPVVLAWNDMRGQDADRDLEVHAMALPTPARFGETGLAKWAGRLRRLPERNFLAADRAETAALIRLAEATRPMAILAQYGQTGLRMLPVARAVGLPLVVHFHGHDLSFSLRNRWYRHSLRRALPAFSAIVVVGAHQRERLCAMGVAPDRIHLLPCGVPVAEFAPADPPATGPVVFVAVSRLVASKGVDLTLAAFARLVERGINARLTIVGEGPDRGALQAAAAPLGERVRFLGAVSPDEVRRQLGQSAVFLQHSLGAPDFPQGSEGSPVAIAEAQAMALPVVVALCGGVAELVHDGRTGIVVPQRDVAAMADAMERLARNPGLRGRMGAAGRAHVAAGFDAPAQVVRLEAVVAAAAAEGPRGRL